MHGRKKHDRIFRYTGGAGMPVKEVIELLKKGKALAKRTKFKEAMAHYEKAITLDPKYPESWYLRASVFAETGRYKEAIADCDKAISLDQNYSDAWSKKGLVLYNLERFEEAVYASTRAATLNGNDVTAWFIKGVSLDELGRSDEAQEAYGKSLELEIILDMEAEAKKMRRQ
jgi:Flp pilus assembly protein TadD